MSKESRIIKSLQRKNEPKTPVGGEFFLPNYSVQEGMKSFYGEIYSNDESDVIVVNPGTWTKINIFDVDGESQGVLVDYTKGCIEIYKPGVYEVRLDTSFSGSGSVEWNVHAFIDNGSTILENIGFHRKLGASGDVGSASTSGLVRFNSGDIIMVYAMHAEIAQKNIIFKDISLSVNRLGK